MGFTVRFALGDGSSESFSTEQVEVRQVYLLFNVKEDHAYLEVREVVLWLQTLNKRHVDSLAE